MWITLSFWMTEMQTSQSLKNYISLLMRGCYCRLLGTVVSPSRTVHLGLLPAHSYMSLGRTVARRKLCELFLCQSNFRCWEVVRKCRYMHWKPLLSFVQFTGHVQRVCVRHEYTLVLWQCTASSWLCGSQDCSLLWQGCSDGYCPLFKYSWGVPCSWILWETSKWFIWLW